MIFEPGKIINFLTYPPPTLIHLSQHFTSVSKPTTYKSFDYCLSQFAPPFQPLCHSETLPCFLTQLWTALCNKHFPLYIGNIRYECPLHQVLLSTKNTQQNAVLQQYTPQTQWPFWLLKPASEHAHLPPRLSWSWMCCYLVIHIDNLLHSLQLLYFHLWPI
jgi:hypothetical protein